MLKIMLIRHLPTPGNEKRQYIGSTDEDLSKKAVLPKWSYPAPECIIVSPMKRCIQTAKRIWGLDLSGCPVVLEPMMRECDFGQFEGKTYEQLKKEPAYIKWLDSGGMTAFPEGEDQKEFRKRCVKGMKKQIGFLLDQHVKYAAFVVHGGTIMAVMHALSEEKKDFYDWQVKNGSGYFVSVSEKEWRNGKELLKNAVKLEEIQKEMPKKAEKGSRQC